MPRRDAHSSSVARGFTLVELLVCLAIMGLLLGVMPSLMAGGRSSRELRAATNDLITALREARSSAVSQGKPAAVDIDANGGSYRTAAGAVHRLPRGIAVAVIASEEKRQDPARGPIRFFADGSSTGGGLHLTGGDRHLTILVEWLTGRVSLGEDAP
jgi:general secretion pathway protein H